MNITDFYTINDESVPLPFDCSEFVPGFSDKGKSIIGDVIKSLVIGYTLDENDPKIAEMPKQLATGGISTGSSKATRKEPKWSFCKEVSTMNISLVGLLGFDFAKYLFALVGIKQILQNMINTLSEITNWSHIIQLVESIHNVYKLKDLGEDDELDCLQIDPSFDLHKYLDNKEKLKDDGSAIISYYIVQNTSEETREIIFQYITTYIDDRYKSKSESIVRVRKYIKEIFDDLIINTKLGKYTIDGIDKLCINLGDYDVCYSPSFLKSFEVYYKESYGDVYADKPHIDMIEKWLNPAIITAINASTANKTVKKVETKKVVNELTTYYKSVFIQVKANSIESLDTAVLNVICTDDLIEELVDITMFLFVQISRNLSSILISNKYSGTNTRIQFQDFYQAILQCAPHLELFNLSQRNILYWVICPSSSIAKSIAALQNKDKPHEKSSCKR